MHVLDRLDDSIACACMLFVCVLCLGFGLNGAGFKCTLPFWLKPLGWLEGFGFTIVAAQLR